MEPLSAAYLNKTEFLVEPVGDTQLCSAFWASPQVQLRCGVMMAHFVAVHCLFIFLISLQVFPVSLKNLADTFLVLSLVPCCWIENYCRHFFFFFCMGILGFWDCYYGSNEQVAKQRKKNLFPAHQKSWLSCGASKDIVCENMLLISLR